MIRFLLNILSDLTFFQKKFSAVERKPAETLVINNGNSIEYVILG